MILSIIKIFLLIVIVLGFVSSIISGLAVSVAIIHLLIEKIIKFFKKKLLTNRK